MGRAGLPAAGEEPAQSTWSPTTVVLGLAILAALIIFASFAGLYVRFPGDSGVSHWVQSWRPSWFVSLMKVITYCGDPKVAAPLVAVVTAALYVKKLRSEAFFAAAAPVVAFVIRIIVKELVARPRPTEDLVQILNHAEGFSFPSGHVLHYVAFLGTLVAMAYLSMKPGAGRHFLVAGFLIVVGVIGFTRIYLGAHWLSDVIGGYAFGASVAAVAVWARWKWKQRAGHSLSGAHPPPLAQRREDSEGTDR